jgi:phenylacetic acid degradation operon negative regulatory protein
VASAANQAEFAPNAASAMPESASGRGCSPTECAHRTFYPRIVKTTLLQRSIQTLRTGRPVRANSLIITVYGDSIAPHGGTVWLGSFIRLVEPLGLNARMVRTAVFRLSKEDWLVAERIGRRSFYSLTSTGRRRFEHAYRRIYHEPSKEWNGDWQLVFTGAGNLPAAEREALKKELLWEGFGALAPGVFAHPSANVASLSDILESNAVRHKVVVMRARSLGPLVSIPLRDLVRACWNLEEIAKHYHQFIERFGSVLEALRMADAVDPEQCFVVQTMLLHEYRRVLLRDPQLPDQLLPRNWPGNDAWELCRALYRITHRPVQRHLGEILETPSGRLPLAAPYFYERFGGLDSDRGTERIGAGPLFAG